MALRAALRLPDSSLVAHKLIDFELITVASPASVKKHGTPRRAEDLAAHRMVQLGQGLSTWGSIGATTPTKTR